MKKGVSLALSLCVGLTAITAVAKKKARIDIKVEEEKEARRDSASYSQVIIPAQEPPAKTVSELLEKAASVQLKQYGGLDDFAAVSIRGSTTEQVLIYLDGILLNTAHGGVLDLSLIPVDRIERIEIYKGGAPGKTTDSTPGGVIYIETKKKTKKTEHILRNSFGSFFTYRGHIERSQNFESLYYNAAFNHFRSRGDFPFLDNRGTRNNTSDDRTVRRQNNDFQAYDFSATVGQDKKEGFDWKFYENFFVKHQGIPGFGAQTSSAARLNTLRNLAQFELKNKIWQTNLFFDFLNSRFEDRQSEIGLGTQDNDDLIFRFGPEFRISKPLADHHNLSGFFAHRAEIFMPTNNTASPPEGPTSQRHMIGLGGEDEMSFDDDKIILDPSARLQIFVNHLSGTDPSSTSTAADNNATDAQISAKLGVKISPWPYLSFKSNVARGFRQPTFGELFGDRGTIVGNPSLEPEESLNFDAGLEFRQKEIGPVDRLQFSVALFRNKIENLIQFLQTSQFTVRAQNLNSALIRGVEATLAIQAFENLRWNSHYVFQNTKDNEPTSPTFGNTLPGRPQHQFFISTDYQWRFLKPFVELQIMANNFLDSQNLLKATRRTLLAAGLALTPHKKVELSFSAKNILNDRIEDLVGYPLPGRSYWGEAEFNF